MQTKLFISNIAWQTTDEQLREAFAAHGTVVSAELVKNTGSGETRGFAFVEMSTQVAAEAAVRFLNLRELNGRQITVRFAEDSKGRSTARKKGGRR